VRLYQSRWPICALGFIEMANLLLDVGDFYGAVGAYLRAAEIYRNEDRDYMVFELLEGVLDICPESLSAAKEIVRIRHTIDKEGQARAFYRLAVAYLLNDSQYEAIASLEAAVEVCPSYRDARDLMNGIRPEEQREFGVTGVADILDDIDNVKTDTSKRALADIIMEFKTGVDASVSREDYSTHFDLGIAYREMGLLRESIQEFERVLVSPQHRIKAREMLGRCTFDMRRYDEAEDHFRKGMVLATALEDKNALLGFHVNLSRVYEFTGRNGNAEAEMNLAIEIDPVMAKALILE
jgi:tetratricopeptide (TPR) repeat protein